MVGNIFEYLFSFLYNMSNIVCGKAEIPVIVTLIYNNNKYYENLPPTQTQPSQYVLGYLAQSDDVWH